MDLKIVVGGWKAQGCDSVPFAQDATLRNERLGQVDKGSDRVCVAPSLIRQETLLRDDDKEDELTAWKHSCQRFGGKPHYWQKVNVLEIVEAKVYQKVNDHCTHTYLGCLADGSAPEMIVASYHHVRN
jgi:hypothetical protein